MCVCVCVRACVCDVCLTYGVALSCAHTNTICMHDSDCFLSQRSVSYIYDDWMFNINADGSDHQYLPLGGIPQVWQKCILISINYKQRIWINGCSIFARRSMTILHALTHSRPCLLQEQLDIPQGWRDVVLHLHHRKFRISDGAGSMSVATGIYLLSASFQPIVLDQQCTTLGFSTEVPVDVC